MSEGQSDFSKTTQWADPQAQDSASAQQYRVLCEDLWRWRKQARIMGQQQRVDPSGADWLLREVAHLDRLQLHLAKPEDYLVLSCTLDDLQDLWQRHCRTQTPLQYLVGWVSWRDLHLQVNSDVLIPRPETELIVDFALQAFNHHPDLQRGHWVDVGTGSGAIPIALALAFKDLRADFSSLKLQGVDCSEGALAIAQKNGEHYGLGADIVQWNLGSWLSPFESWKGQNKIVALIANPPYIPTSDLAFLDPQVRNHEPHLALDGGPDGLDALRILVKTAPDYLRQGGLWLVEVMAGQAGTVAQLLAGSGRYDNITIHQDFEGQERFVEAQVK